MERAGRVWWSNIWSFCFMCRRRRRKPKRRKTWQQTGEFTSGRRRSMLMSDGPWAVIGSLCLRSLQSLCEELILNEFLIKPQTVRLSEFIGNKWSLVFILLWHKNCEKKNLCMFVSPGEFSYLGSTLRQANNDPAPSLSDVRQLVTLYAVLPLGQSEQPKTGRFWVKFCSLCFLWFLSRFVEL